MAIQKEIYSFDTFISWQQRLTHFCARLTGHAEISEDLAQETLLEAWRHQHKFVAIDDEDQSYWKWLSAIARYVCKRWLRQQYTNRTLSASCTLNPDEEEGSNLEEMIPDPGSIEIELEREELAILLDRAMALLPSALRDVLIERYIYESSHKEILEKLQISENTLVQRLYRGKLKLRKMLSTELAQDFAAYGVLPTTKHTPLSIQQTRIACPFCGIGRLLFSAKGVLQFSCSRCWTVAGNIPHDLVDGLKSAKSILARQIERLGTYYWEAINTGSGKCFNCGSSMLLSIYNPEDDFDQSSILPYTGVWLSCTRCEYQDLNPLPHLLLDTRESQQFWRQHPRIHWIPPQKIEYEGHIAFSSSFQSNANASRLDFICDSLSLKILAIHKH